MIILHLVFLSSFLSFKRAFRGVMGFYVHFGVFEHRVIFDTRDFEELFSLMKLRNYSQVCSQHSPELST